MKLLERESYLDSLAGYYHRVEQGSGYTVFLAGEAGIGKTSLVNNFVQEIASKSIIYSGACDLLFTPRPLGPLYDIAVQIGQDFIDVLKNENDRSLIFTTLGQKLSVSEKPVVLVFEDIHWADEATIDLIKFLARRIHLYRCLFLLTYRDNEIHSRHPLATIFGELLQNSFSKIQIERFSKGAVDRLAKQKGYVSGEQLYALTSGNPFYVTEILAAYSPGIPERVKDSILAVFNSRSEDTRALWEFLSILPTSYIELNIARRIEKDFANCIDSCIASGVIVSRLGHLSFKHDLYRLTIEESLPISKRKALHKKMLDILLEGPVDKANLSQLVHHARYADDKELVARYAPQAAKEAASVGAHIEARKLYMTAIDFTDEQDPALVELYEHYAYESYLTNQITAAIASQQQALDIWRSRKVNLKEGDALRFLSRLYWFDGNRFKAMTLAQEAIEILENGFPTRERALAYSNLSQLSMLSDDQEKTLYWGNKAIDLAMRMEDKEVLSHALNNVGTVLINRPASETIGEMHLNRSLSIALENGFHEHAARAYVNLSSSFVYSRRYEKAIGVFDVGLKYCEERDLNSWRYYLYGCNARLLFEMGKWKDAEAIAMRLQPNLHHSSIVNIDATITLAKLAIRQGRFKEARLLIQEVKEKAIRTNEAQRVVPLLTTLLELAWIANDPIPVDEIKAAEDTLFFEKNYSWHYANLIYWMRKCGLPPGDNSTIEFAAPFGLEIKGDWKAAAELWERTGCTYEQALALFDGDEENQKQALTLLDHLGATATRDKLKAELKLKGVKKIPRGLRDSTRMNPAQLTNRQIEVLLLLKEGLQNIEIADRLFISPKTVDHHITAILSHLDVNSRTKAVREAQKLGILK